MAGYIYSLGRNKEKTMDTGLNIQILPSMPGEGTWHYITCKRCSSELRLYDNPSLGPKLNIPANCPVCGADLGVESVRGQVQVLERKLWPTPLPIADIPEWVKEHKAASITIAGLFIGGQYLVFRKK